MLIMIDGKRRLLFTSSNKIPACLAVIYLYVLSNVLGSPEFDLKRQLLTSYDKDSRPVKNNTKPITIHVDMALQHITHLDERYQIFKTSVWMRWYWNDEYLVWDPSNHSSITSLHISPSTIWTPDIALYNNVKAEESDWTDTYDVVVTNTGSVSWLFPAIVETSCKVDVSNFPYDTQICFFKLGSWGYSGSQLDVQNKSPSGDITAFIDNGVWELQKLSVTRSVRYYTCCTEPYPDITFAAQLKRRYLFYIINLILPCILFTVLNLCTFLLPVGSGEKITLNVTVLLALDVFLLMVAESMPPQSETVPDLGIYFITCIVAISMSTVCSVFVIHLYYRGSRGHSVPKWVRQYIIFGIGPVLGYSEIVGARSIYRCRSTKVDKSDNETLTGKCITAAKHGQQTTLSSLVHSKHTQNKQTRRTSLTPSENIILCSLTPLNHNRSDANGTVPVDNSEDNGILQHNQMFPSSNHIRSLYSDMADDSQHVTTSSQSDTDHNVAGTHDITDPVRDPVLEWQNVSLVMNRLFFVILTIATIALTVFSLAHIS